MAKITTHVLDTSRGRPASAVPITLEVMDPSGPRLVASGQTDDDGRLKTLTDPGGVDAGTYRLTFDVGAYFARLAQESFYPLAQVTFVVRDAGAHFHVPLLLQPYGFSTYRGS